ncbi:MAG: gliding motility-associated C-terminal domain-containing protein, partial [Elusimicrobiota bacterium]|nr:gliding motility-associated C-terminal domain-containing protein [Elusimicrobiota bacterium]
NIPVTKGVSADICGEFENQSFFAPNPYAGTDGYFKIRVPIDSDISLKIYNIAGDLIFKDEFTGQAHDTSVSGSCGSGYYCWPKVNSSGNTVTHGVYYYVLRLKGTQGGREVCQTVKKILIP